MTNVIEARNVVFSFGKTPALRGASIAVDPGEILAIMGPSGSGKSTLLHCLAGILVPDSGEILFGGARIDSMTETERSSLRRDRFGFVFQFGQLVPELTAAENVALPLLLSGVGRTAALRKAYGWFERLGLDGMEQRRSGELSRGGRRSASPSPAVWSPGRRFSSPTSRPVRSTRSPASRSWTCWWPRPASRAPRSSWSPTSHGSPRTPTARSSSATGA